MVVSGFTQPAHGRVTLLGARAIYTPDPGFSGDDSFRYTISDPAGGASTGMVVLGVAALTPSCTLTIAGPGSAIKGPAIQLTATPVCNFGAPEIQWLHRTGTSGTFAVFKNFSTQTSADFPTTSSALGAHQFQAKVRIQGTTPRFTSNTVTTTLVASTSPCTAVVLDLPAAGSVFATGQPISLHGTATCPAGVVPEYQYWVKQPQDAGFTVLPGFVPGGSSYTPPQAGSWVLAVAARAVGSSDPFQVQSAPVTVVVSHAPTAVDDTLTVDEDTTGTVDVLANDSDPDGDSLTATIVGPPAGGTASISAGVITYHPAANYNGSDAIGYRINDGHGNTATATVHVTITPEQDAPSAHHDFATVAEDGSVAVDVTANDTDVDGDPLTVIAHSSPAHGTVVFTGNVATYTPAANFHGSDTFEYT
ncbi:MAG TPA: Ig-like domain-containing protein, partial [Kofleriaceae bacterium]|nr:Ig-like domain-containing protein [Kofleriaceae bacterium]